MAKKSYVLDTNVYLTDAHCFKKFGRNDIILCENNQKKVSFLSAVTKECQLKIKIFKGRIESYKNINTRIIVSRAFAPLKFLLNSIKHIIKSDKTFTH